MRLYVAGPMRGYVDKNIPAFNAAERELRAAGYEVVNPARHDDTVGQTYEWYLRKALQDVVQDGIDGIAVLECWQRSAGAQLEVNIAHALKLRVCTVAAWVLCKGEPHAFDPGGRAHWDMPRCRVCRDFEDAPIHA